MRITNRFGLPDSIVEAVRNDDYDPGDSYLTASQFPAPAQKVELERRHAEDLVEDASERIYSLLGQAIHGILERSEPSALVEERLFAEFLGKKISGRYDRLVLRDELLQDYKVTSIYSGKEGAKDEWVEQLNVLAELAVLAGYSVSRLEVVAIYRDWSKRRAEQVHDYPKSQVERIKIPLWGREARRQFIELRIREQVAAETTPLECSPEDRWLRGEAWAVMKKGNKRAIPGGLQDTQELAEALAKEKGPGHYVEYRPGENVRCEAYCSVVRFCEQAKRLGVSAAREQVAA